MVKQTTMIEFVSVSIQNGFVFVIVCSLYFILNVMGHHQTRRPYHLWKILPKFIAFFQMCTKYNMSTDPTSTQCQFD